MSKIYLLVFAGLFSAALPLAAQNFNRPVPPQVPRYEFVLYDSTFQGYYLTAPFLLGGAGVTTFPKPTMILDSKGYLLWYMPVQAWNVLDFKYNPAIQRYQFIKLVAPQQVRFMLLDTDFNPVDSFTTVNGVTPDVHDFQFSKNNTILLTGEHDTILNLSGYLFDGTPGSASTRAIGFVVQELDADRNLLFQWSSNEYIHPGETYIGHGYNPVAFDYCHGNTIEEDTDGNLLLSFRNLDAILKINRQTGAVLWQLGGKHSDFTFSNDAGFSGQHDARRLPNGNIAVFDNANLSPTPRHSRAVEYQLDTVNWIATKVWEYRHVPGFLSSAMGGHQTTADRRHLINYGLNYRPDPSMVLVDDSGEKLTELFFQDSFMSYRAYLFDLPLGSLQRPAIACTQNAGLVTLSAPPGLAQYVWSTGETSASIEVQTPGAYQVWVPQGAGMLGSEPFVIESLASACPVSGVSEATGSENRTVVGWYDLLGREVPAPVQRGFGGRLYLVRYVDGQFALKLH